MQDEDKICNDCGQRNTLESLNSLVHKLSSSAASSTSTDRIRSSSVNIVNRSNSDEADDLSDQFGAADDDDDDSQSMCSQDLQSHFLSTSDTPNEMCATGNGSSRNRQGRFSSVSAPLAPLAEVSQRECLKDIAEMRVQTLQRCNPTAMAVQESFCKVLSRKIWNKYYLVLTANYMLQFRAAKLVPAHNLR